MKPAGILKTFGSVLLCTAILIGANLSAFGTAEEPEYIDNSDVMPKYVTDEFVTMEDSNADGTLQSPDWLKTAIMVEVRLDTCTEEGTLEAAVEMLDHYQEMGVNLLWITPVNEMGKTLANPNGYTNYGPHTIDPGLTGTTDYEEGWESFAWFVREAHKRNIRIILDFVIWGVDPEAPLLQERPELFSGESSKWGGPEFDYESEVFQTWYKEVMHDIIMTTELDGLRIDLEPTVTGYDLWKEIRDEAYAAGRKIVIMSEHPNERNQTYDFEQWGVESFKDGWSRGQNIYNPVDYFMDHYDPVDAIKSGEGIGSQLSQLLKDSGQYRFYTYCLTDHDYGFTTIRGNLLRVGYQAMFTPFIPLWIMGEEMECEVTNFTAYYEMRLDYSNLDDPEIREFYETLKKYIRIRRLYPDIFNYYPLNHRESNICEVSVAGQDNLQSYARFDENGNGIIIVPNANLQNKDGKMTVTIPYNEMGLGNYTSFTVTDLMNDRVIAKGDKEKAGMFEVTVPYEELGIYLVEGAGKVETPDDGDNTSDPTNTQTPGGAETVSSEESTMSSSEQNAGTAQQQVIDRTVNKTVYQNGANYLGWPFWLAVGIGGVLAAAAAVVLIIYLVKRKKRLGGVDHE